MPGLAAEEGALEERVADLEVAMRAQARLLEAQRRLLRETTLALQRLTLALEARTKGLAEVDSELMRAIRATNMRVDVAETGIDALQAAARLG